MRRLSCFSSLLIFLSTTSHGAASLILLRSMPPPKTSVVWEMSSSPSMGNSTPTFRLTAGDVAQRDGRSFQTLDVEGDFPDGDKLLHFKARFEVDLATLKQDGHAAKAARLLKSWIGNKSALEEIGPDDMRLQFFKVMMFKLEAIEVDANPTDAPDDALKDYKFRLLRAKADSRHAGSGNVPTADFKAWVSDEIPFGVGKWICTLSNLAGDGVSFSSSCAVVGIEKPGDAATPARPIGKDLARSKVESANKGQWLDVDGRPFGPNTHKPVDPDLVEPLPAATSAIVYFRSMPPPKTSVVFELGGPICRSGMTPAVRLTAGDRLTRDNLEYQILDITGIYTNKGGPIEFKARYEIDLELLKHDGHPARAARLLNAWIKKGDDLEEVARDHKQREFFEKIMFTLEDPYVQDKSVTRDEQALKDHKFNKLRGIGKTKAFTSNSSLGGPFSVWVSDTIPFGVGAWWLLPMGRTIKKPGASTYISGTVVRIDKPDEPTPPDDNGKNEKSDKQP